VGGLACSIRTNKTRYEPGEDVLIDFLLRGEVGPPVTVMRPLTHFSYLGTALPAEIEGPNGKHEYTGPVLEPPPPPSRGAYVSITRGEIIGVWSVHRHPLRIVPKYWSMTAPGRYTLRLRFVREDNEYYDAQQRKMVKMTTAWRGELLSNAVVVEIAEKKPSQSLMSEDRGRHGVDSSREPSRQWIGTEGETGGHQDECTNTCKALARGGACSVVGGRGGHRWEAGSAAGHRAGREDRRGGGEMDRAVRPAHALSGRAAARIACPLVR
jgi:hypothetical protein